MSNISASAFSDTKAHYDLLDGLRGVAALMVIWYHVFEGFAFASNSAIETLNHGYLAVDFFFILSGFVIGYAYDDRWGKSLTMKDFIKRRLIRLHPMVIMGAIVVGAITLLYSGVCTMGRDTHRYIDGDVVSALYDLFHSCNARGVGYEVRGNGEMFPLNGPCWSLFFEYIGNILYALFIRRLSNKALTIVVVLLGVALASFAILMLALWKHRSRLDAGWGKLYRRIIKYAFPLSIGYAYIAQLQAYEVERCILDMYSHCNDRLVRSALFGRIGTNLHKWYL